MDLYEALERHCTSAPSLFSLAWPLLLITEMIRFSRPDRFRLRRLLRLGTFLASLWPAVLSWAEPGLTPDDPAAFFARAAAYQEQRHYGRALADLEAAALITPTPEIERAKAFLLFYLGRMTQSAESFERYLGKHPGDGAAVLFRYLAEAKIGNAFAAARELEADARKLQMRGWPSPLVDFHLGRIDEKAVFAAVEAGDPKLRNDRLCAANFHAAESRLFRAYVSGAIPLLRAAVKGCPPDLHEAHAAASELERLGHK